jgi:hypothetical protein
VYPNYLIDAARFKKRIQDFEKIFNRSDS